MPETANSLRQLILAELQRRPGLKATELADALGRDRRDINRCLSDELKGLVRQDNDYRWRLVRRDAPVTTPVPAQDSEIARLCRYYLECVSQDMDEGVSVFARNQYGDLDYAQLESVPISSDVEWWNAPGAATLMGKAGAARGKKMLWLGYPIRLRRHRTAKWEGFFVEPVLMWPVLLPEESSDAPRIDQQLPIVNTKFLRSVAMGDGMQLAEESAKLSEELGLGVRAEELPAVDDLVDRLVRIRPDWDWQESLDPAAVADPPRVADISAAGIYNRAVIILGERSPYTLGLETELKALAGTKKDDLEATALGCWLAAEVASPSSSTANLDTLIEVLPMNTGLPPVLRTMRLSALG